MAGLDKRPGRVKKRPGFILSRLDGFEDDLEDGVNGLAFDQNDASGTNLARKLESLMGDARAVTL